MELGRTLKELFIKVPMVASLPGTQHPLKHVGHDVTMGSFMNYCTYSLYRLLFTYISSLLLFSAGDAGMQAGTQAGMQAGMQAAE